MKSRINDCKILCFGKISFRICQVRLRPGCPVRELWANPNISVADIDVLTEGTGIFGEKGGCDASALLIGFCFKGAGPISR